MFVLDDVIDAKEAGKLLKVHARTVVRLAEKGEIPAFRVGDLWRFRRVDIEDFVKKQMHIPPEEKR